MSSWNIAPYDIKYTILLVIYNMYSSDRVSHQLKMLVILEQSLPPTGILLKVERHNGPSFFTYDQLLCSITNFAGEFILFDDIKELKHHIWCLNPPYILINHPFLLGDSTFKNTTKKPWPPGQQRREVLRQMARAVGTQQLNEDDLWGFPGDQWGCPIHTQLIIMVMVMLI